MLILGTTVGGTVVTVSDLDDVDSVDRSCDGGNDATVYLFYLFGDAEPVPMRWASLTTEGQQVVGLWSL